MQDRKHVMKSNRAYLIIDQEKSNSLFKLFFTLNFEIPKKRTFLMNTYIKQ